MIARSNITSQRVFPLIRANLYDLSKNLTELTHDQQVGRNLLTLTNQEFTRWERLLGWKLDIQGQMGRLLLQHRLAMEAELAAQWQRADFFWCQLQIELKALSKRDNVWQALASSVANDSGITVMGDPVQLRQRLVDELLIDTHCAFYNGLEQQVEKLSLKDRAFVHIDYIQEFLDLSALSGESLLSVLGLPWEQRLTLYKEAKKWKQALQVCTMRLKYFPNSIDYQNELAEVHFLATLAKLRNSKSEAQQLKDAKTLQGGISLLEKISKDYPYNLSVFEFLSHLHHLRAISLGNGGHLAEALVAVQKALTYNPYLEKASETRNDLVRMMNQLQAQMRDIKSNVTLNEKGKRLQAEASQGFTLMNNYIESTGAEATAYVFKLAQAISIWRSIGLAEPAAGWSGVSSAVMQTNNGEVLLTESTAVPSKQALLLLNGLNHIFSNPPKNKASLGNVWEEVVVKNSDLAELNSVLIYAFLERRLFGGGDEPVTASTPVLPLDSLILTPLSTKRKPGAEPFIPWLFSRQDGLLKLQAAVASVLVLTAGGLTIQDTLIRSARNAAYRQILEADQRQDDLSVVKGAETFFAATPLNGKDRREQQVKKLYSEALVRWFAQQVDRPDANAQVHIDRYRAVMSQAK